MLQEHVPTLFYKRLSLLFVSKKEMTRVGTISFFVTRVLKKLVEKLTASFAFAYVSIIGLKIASSLLVAKQP